MELRRVKSVLRHWTLRRIAVISLIVLSLAIVSVGASLWHQRSVAISDGVREAYNIAAVLDGQIASSIQAVDVVLQSVRQSVQDGGVLDGTAYARQADLYRLRETMLQRLLAIPQAFQIVVTDRQGRVVVTTAKWPTPNLDFSDRSFVKELSSADDDRISISLPVSSRFSGDKVILLARRVSGADGTYFGAVSISVKLTYFAGIYGAISSIQHRVFLLLRRDGTFMTRYPDAEDRAGQKLSTDSPFYTAIAKGGGTYQVTSMFDHVIRWVAAIPMKEYPLAVCILIPEEILLRDWRKHSAVTVATTAALLMCTLALLYVVISQFGRLKAAQMALRREHVELQAREADLLIQNQRFDAALNNMGQGLVMFDADAKLVVCNDRYRAIYGLPQEQATRGEPLRKFLQVCWASVGVKGDLDTYATSIMTSVSRRQSFLRELECRNDRVIQVSVHPMQSGGWVTTHEDITERRTNEAKVTFLAHNDVLTGTANRFRFLKLMKESQLDLLTNGRPFSVFMIDLDHFKRVNDSLGHAGGDELLQETAKRLKRSISDGCETVARLGGDEFAIIQLAPREREPSGDACDLMRESAIILANRIIDTIGRPYKIRGQNAFIGVSIGIAMAPGDGSDPDDLLRKADLALYEAKTVGRNGYRFFSQDLAAIADERQQLEVAMRAGLIRSEFELHYQPQIDMSTGRPFCMEALVRWRHPDRGLLMPGRFIPLAEDTGLITPLGECVLQMACRDAVDWPSEVKVAINVSLVQLQKSNLFDVIMCALVETSLPPERLEIEITESVLLEHEAEHMVTLHQLKSLGVSVALDNFGAGYASLSYLTVFPFDKIKIEQSFTNRMLQRADCAAIVRAIVDLGRSLDIVTIAEGVETDEQLAALRAVGLTRGQGFLFGRPVPATELRFEAFKNAKPAPRLLQHDAC